MRTRLFAKPDLKHSQIEVSESVFRDPKELKALKAKVKPEVYLAALYAQIDVKKQETIRVAREAEEAHVEAETRQKEELRGRILEVSNLEAIIAGKRAERDHLERPLTERTDVLNKREFVLNEMEQSLSDRENALLIKDQGCDRRFEALEDMADELGDRSLQLSRKEKRVSERESLLAEREMAYLAKIERLNQDTSATNSRIQDKETAIQLKELNLQGKEENLESREKALAREKLLVKSQRQALLAAQIK